MRKHKGYPPSMHISTLIVFPANGENENLAFLYLAPKSLGGSLVKEHTHPLGRLSLHHHI